MSKPLPSCRKPAKREAVHEAQLGLRNDAPHGGPHKDEVLLHEVREEDAAKTSHVETSPAPRKTRGIPTV